MTNGWATSSTMRRRAGVTKAGPRNRSWSSSSRSRRPGRGAAGSTRTLPTATPSAREDPFHFLLGPGDRLLGRGTRDRLGDHVGQDELVGDLLDLAAGRGRPAVAVELDPFRLPERGELGIGLQHRVIKKARVDRQVEGVAGHDVLVKDFLLAEQVADPLLGRLGVLGELPDPDVPG